MSRTVEVETISDAWLGACAALLELPSQAATHLVLRMSSPLPERANVRDAADRFLAGVPNCQPINEVRNTIFPAELAADWPTPSDLAEVYLEHYDAIRRLAGANKRGTYFGRICAYPRADGSHGDQLVNTAEKLRKAAKGPRVTSIYELNIYSEKNDRRVPRGFPCMSHLAFHVNGDRLDALATYRNHRVIHKGYGNYLGIASLQDYLARYAGFELGELIVIAGHADVELSADKRRELRELINAFD